MEYFHGKVDQLNEEELLGVVWVVAKKEDVDSLLARVGAVLLYWLVQVQGAPASQRKHEQQLKHVWGVGRSVVATRTKSCSEHACFHVVVM